MPIITDIVEKQKEVPFVDREILENEQKEVPFVDREILENEIIEDLLDPKRPRNDAVQFKHQETGTQSKKPKV